LFLADFGAAALDADVLAVNVLAVDAFTVEAFAVEILAVEPLAVLRVVVRVSLTGGRAGPLLALCLLEFGLAAAVFFETLVFEVLVVGVLEILFLRVFCDTACARKPPRPCLIFVKREPGRAKNERHQTAQLLECTNNSTFSAKINGLCPLAAAARPSGGAYPTPG